MAYLIEAVGTKENRGSIVIKNGTIDAPERAIHLVDCDLKLENVKIDAVGRCIGAYNNAKVEIDSRCELTTTGDDVCIMMYSTTGRTDAMTELELAGKVKSTKAAQGTWTISGNGSANHGNTKITIKKGAEVSCVGDSAIYHPQGGDIIIDGGKVEGPDGVYMKSGKLIVNAGEIIGNGSAETTYTYTGNGTETPLGHGIVMEFTDYPAGIAELEINGGSVTALEKDAIGYYISPTCEIQDLDELKKAKVVINA